MLTGSRHAGLAPAGVAWAAVPAPAGAWYGAGLATDATEHAVPISMVSDPKREDPWCSAVPQTGFRHEKPRRALENPPDALIISTRWG